jgi:hypothetical protein
MRSSICRQAAALLFLVAFFPATWISGHSQTSKPSNATVAKGWKKVDLGDFSFYAPPDMKNQNVRGIDSAVWQFRNSSMTLDLDYGMHSNNLKSHADQPEYQEEWFLIDGKQAKVATLRMDDNRGRKYVAAVHFPDVSGGGGTRLTAFASCRDRATQQSAKSIFLSIKWQ